MIKTVPHDVLISYVVGHLFAIVGYKPSAEADKRREKVRFRRALAFQFLVFVPIGIFLLIVRPSWSFLYLVDPVGPLVVLSILGLLCYVAAMVIGYKHGVYLARKGNLRGSLISIGIALATGGILLIIALRRFLFIGTYEEFQALSGTPPINFFEPTILIIAAVIGVYFLGPMIYVLYRNWKT